MVIGLALIVLARQVAPRQAARVGRRRWRSSLAAVAHVVKGPAPIAGARTRSRWSSRCVWNRDAFPARPDPARCSTSVRFVPLYLGSCCVFGFGTLLLESEHVEEGLTFFGMLETTCWG